MFGSAHAAMELGISRIILESDSMNLVQAITTSEFDQAHASSQRQTIWDGDLCSSQSENKNGIKVKAIIWLRHTIHLYLYFTTVSLLERVSEN